jgi:serine/threonine protein kinase
MNPIARPKPAGLLPETVHYTGSDSGIPSDPPCMNEQTPAPSARASERYIFGSGARPLDGFTIKRAIGRGGFGEVYYALSDSGKEVALKLLLRNVDIEKRGVQQCMNLKSPHLITVYDMRETEDGDTFVVMEYVSGPSLAQILARHPDGLPPHEVRMWMKGLVDGVEYLHDHGIVHRDLKPANLFLEEGVVKIGDYGLSKFMANSIERGHSTSVGTCHYMAPEISTGKYQRPIDIYAMGIILYELLTGTVPFHGETAQEVLMKHLTAQPDLSPLAEPYRSIVARALVKDPAVRPQEARELLLSEDLPVEQPVRFIGDNKVSPAGAVEHVIAAGLSREQPIPTLPPTPAPPPAPPVEDILHIGEQEAVFYIGPNTMPPRRGFWEAVRRPRPARRAGAKAARHPAPSLSRRAVPAPPPPSQPAPALKPVPLPDGRLRVAEAATSMFLAAPLGMAAALPTAAAAGLHVPDDWGGIALLVGLILLGAWAVLVPAKLWEGRQVDGVSRRLTLAGAGIGLGGLLLVGSQWAHIRMGAGLGNSPGMFGELATEMGLDHEVVEALGFLGALGLCFALGGWESMAARDRKARFRLVPLVKVAVVGGLVALVLPAPVPMLPVYLVGLSAVVQLASPWCRESARYAEAARRARRKGIAAA